MVFVNDVLVSHPVGCSDRNGTIQVLLAGSSIIGSLVFDSLGRSVPMPDAPWEKGTRRQALDDCGPEVAGRGSGVSDDAGSQTREYFTRSVRREKGGFW